MAVRFHAPPGWPGMPAGWSPSPGWRAEPDWPPVPAGWKFWSSSDSGADLTLEMVPVAQPVPSRTATPTVAAESPRPPAVSDWHPDWHPGLLDPPPDHPDRWKFNAPPGWAVPTPTWRPTSAWQPDRSWPAAPAGWMFWLYIPETWHGLMALGSLVLGILCIPFFNSATPGSAVLGVLVLAAAVGAGVVSRFWTRVRDLPQPAKAYVWGVAIAGGAIGVCGVLAVWLPWRIYDWYRRNF